MATRNNSEGPIRALLERFREHRFSTEQVQRLVESWDLLEQIGWGKVTRGTIERILAEVISQDEDVDEFGYPSVWNLTPLRRQTTIIGGYYPGLVATRGVGFRIGKNQKLLEGADGNFVVPKLSRVAATLGIQDPFGEGYGQLIWRLMYFLSTQYPEVRRPKEEEFTTDRFRLRDSTRRVLLEMEQSVPGDLMLISAQTGQKYAGVTADVVRRQVENSEKEFLLPLWVVGHILLTNPRRLVNYWSLGIDCVGDQCWHDGDPEAFYLVSYRQGLRYAKKRSDVSSLRFGAATGFLG